MIYYQCSTGMMSRCLPDGFVTNEEEPLHSQFASCPLSFEVLRCVCEENRLFTSCHAMIGSQKQYRRRSTLSVSNALSSARRQSDGDLGMAAKWSLRRESNSAFRKTTSFSKDPAFLSSKEENAEMIPPEMKRSSSTREGIATLGSEAKWSSSVSTIHLTMQDRRQNQSFYNKQGLSNLFSIVPSSKSHLVELRELLFDGRVFGTR